MIYILIYIIAGHILRYITNAKIAFIEFLETTQEIQHEVDDDVEQLDSI